MAYASYLFFYLLFINMEGITVLPAFIRPEARVAALSSPPSGPFNRNDSALRWSWRRFGGKTYKSAFIPTSRFEDFVDGEEELSGCRFFVQKTPQKKNPKASNCDPTAEVRNY